MTEKRTHNFCRTDATVCQICNNAWPIATGLLAKNYSCSECGISVHADCKALAAKLTTCATLPSQRVSGIDLNQIVFGTVTFQLVHAYDLTCASNGSALYGMFNIKGIDFIVRKTKEATYEENDCIWDGGVQQFNESKDFSIPVTGKVITTASILFSLWTAGIFSWLDQKVATVDISLLPLIIWHDAVCERWFPLKSVTTDADCGKILLRLMFKHSIGFACKTVDAAILSSPQTRPSEEAAESVKTEIIESIPVPLESSPARKELSSNDGSMKPSPAKINAALVVAPDMMFESPVQSQGSKFSIASSVSVNVGESSRELIKDGDGAEDVAVVSNNTSQTVKERDLQISAKDSRQKDVDDSKHFDAGSLKRWMRGVSSKASQHLTSLFLEDDNAQPLPAVDGDDKQDPTFRELGRVGTLHISIKGATRFNVADAADGDLFVRVTIENTGSLPNRAAEFEARTRTVWNSATPQFNTSWKFSIPNFKCTIRVSLVNAGDNAAIGYFVTSIYSVIMRDADENDSNWSAAAAESYLLFTSTEPSANNENATGNIKAIIKFEENSQGLYWDEHPVVAPPGPEEEFSMERLGKHIGRFQAAINVFIQVYEDYCRLMDWEDQCLTAVCFITFIYVALTINAEYALQAPMFVLVIFATIGRHRRVNGTYRAVLIENKKSGNMAFRPVSKLLLAVIDSKLNLTLPNNPNKKPFVSVSYVPAKEPGLSASASEEYLKEHLIGAFDYESSSTTQSLFSLLGDEKKVRNRECAIQNILVPQKFCVDGTELETVALSYPILQALNPSLHPLPWTSNEGFVKFTVYKEKPAGLVPSCCGFVLIRIRHIAKHNKLKGWFRIQKDDQPEDEGFFDDMSLLESTVFNPHQRKQSQWEAFENSCNSDCFESIPVDEALCADWIHLSIELDTSETAVTSADGKLRSSALQDIMFGLSEEKKPSTISTLWNLRDNVKYVQNNMAVIVDYFETAKNIAVWTVPSKTSPLYQLLIAMWITTIFVPGRYLILLVGLYEFLYKFIPQPDDLPIVTKMNNFMLSIPNDDDLDQVYDGERRRHKSKKDGEVKKSLDLIKGSLAAPVHWQGSIQLRVSMQNAASATAPLHPNQWRSVYAVLQGQRIAWWDTAQDVLYCPVSGQLLLSGHVGVCSASVIEERMVSMGEVDKLLCVFGNNEYLQPSKLTVLCTSSSEKTSLAEAILKLLKV